MKANTNVVHKVLPFSCNFQMLGSKDETVTPSIYRVSSCIENKPILTVV